MDSVFNDFRQYIFDVEPGGTHLLGDETGGGHARRGVYLQQVDVVALGNDVVDADDAVAAQNVV